ncbi:MAG: nucleotidyltransferase domain-containing protein, partial [Raoultibacter sp.]
VAHVASEFPAIERAYLFGSVARGEFDDASDVDVRIELDSSMPFNLHDLGQFGKRIERIVGRSVDVISAREIKNEALAAAIAREKVLVYERKK